MESKFSGMQSRPVVQWTPRTGSHRISSAYWQGFADLASCAWETGLTGKRPICTPGKSCYLEPHFSEHNHLRLICLLASYSLDGELSLLCRGDVERAPNLNRLAAKPCWPEILIPIRHDKQMAKSDAIFKRLLILTLLVLLADLTKLLWNPVSFAVQAQSSTYPLYIEPGVTMLRAPDGSRQLLGKVVIDLRNGNVWGFPTTVQQPYPVDMTQQKPPTSTPFRLGRFDLSAMDQPGH